MQKTINQCMCGGGEGREQELDVILGLSIMELPVIQMQILCPSVCGL